MNNAASIGLLLSLVSCLACSPENPEEEEPDQVPNFISFQEDIDFLKSYTDILTLKEPGGSGLLAVSAALQGRVMTSSSNGYDGLSYGWINRKLFASGDTLEHMNAFGGEERLWLGPEGGQYSIFFQPGDPFDLEHWQTPRLIDLVPFDLLEQTPQKAVFQKKATLSNYAGFTFELGIDRTVEILPASAIFQNLGLPQMENLRVVGYQTTNVITNLGQVDWTEDQGLLSIWLLGMFNPSDAATIVIPFVGGETASLGPVVNDAYFGKVPADRLKIEDGVLFFSADGQYRSKIGLSPGRAKDILGAYDAAHETLTIVKYQKPEGVTEYVNSLWEIQEKPYRGDVINAYNDGPPEPGVEPLGPFYELETSSPALALPSGGSGAHLQQTVHFEGDKAALDEISRQLLGVSLETIQSVFSRENQ